MLAFVHIPKAAGTTISWILRSTFGLRHLDVDTWHKIPQHDGVNRPMRADELRPLLQWMPHIQSIHGHRIQPYADLDEAFPQIRYFAFMRRPQAQYASWYQHLVQAKGARELDFATHFNDIWARNRQSQMLAGVPDANEAINVIKQKNVFVGLVEHFDESLLILKKLVAPQLNLSYERRGVAPSSNIAKGLLENPKTRSMIAEATAMDHELYEYVVNELFPTYRDEYGSTLDQDLMAFRANRGRFNRANVNFSRSQRYVLYQTLVKLFHRPPV